MGFPALNHLGPGPKSLGLAGPLKPSAKSLHPPPEPGNARCTFDPVFPFSPSAPFGLSWRLLGAFCFALSGSLCAFVLVGVFPPTILLGTASSCSAC